MTHTHRQLLCSARQGQHYKGFLSIRRQDDKGVRAGMGLEWCEDGMGQGEDSGGLGR